MPTKRKSCWIHRSALASKEFHLAFCFGPPSGLIVFQWRAFYSVAFKGCQVMARRISCFGSRLGDQSQEYGHRMI